MRATRGKASKTACLGFRVRCRKNCIAIAQSYKNISCKIDCVDILDIAIEKIYDNAKQLGVASSINGIIKPIENYCIEENKYDLVIVVTALEHIDSKKSFLSNLYEISNGIRNNEIVCLVINSDVKETEKSTGKEIPAPVDVNLSIPKLQVVLKENILGFPIIKATVSEQQYDIPRGDVISNFKTKVVIFVARKN